MSDDNVVKLKRTSTLELVFDEDYIEDGCPYRMRIVTDVPEHGMHLGRADIYKVIKSLFDLLQEGDTYNE